MKESIDPDKIHQMVNDDQITKDEALRILESIISESESDNKRIKAIRAIGTLSLLTNHSYKLLEKSMISDESPLMRIESLKIILKYYGASSLTPILWAIENEKSVFFFKHLLDFLESNPQNNLTHIRNQVIDKLTKVYDLAYNDLKFMIDLDYLDAIKFLNQYQAFINKFEVKNDYQRALLSQNTSLDNKGLSRINKKTEGHIVDLVLHDLESIPSSIDFLPKLEFLKIDHCNFKGKDLNNLKLNHLKNLIFSNNQMDELPNWVWNIAKSMNNTNKFIKNAVHTSQVGVLSLLEILTNKTLKPIKIFEKKSQKMAHYYKLDGNGNIIGIFLSNLPSKMGIIPNQLCNLEYLEELHLVNQNIEKIPACLARLRKLRILNLANNNILPVPEIIDTFQNLECLDLHVDEQEI